MAEMTGKGLEKLLQESCKIQGIDCTRLRDAGWQGESTQRRFTVKNICDFVLFSNGEILYVEVKHSKDRLALSRLTQHKDLMAKDAQNIKNLFAGYLVNIDGDTWFIMARAVDEFIVGHGKKSINKTDAQKIGYPVFSFTPARARKPRLDIESLIYELKTPF
jgi:penicillin-binding protein-related factor A (putative recombinase)